jgi:hypothetical protein
MTYAYESGNRRAEVDGLTVSFQRMTGKKRRSRFGWWWQTCSSQEEADWVARGWAFDAVSPLSLAASSNARVRPQASPVRH